MARESFLSLTSMNATSIQSFTPKDSIMIALIVATFCFVRKIQADIVMSSSSREFTPVRNKTISAVSEERFKAICRLTFLSGQRLHSSKTHTTPSCHKPATLNFQTENKWHQFSATMSANTDCCILLSLHLLTGGQRLNASQGELLGTCHLEFDCWGAGSQ